MGVTAQDVLTFWFEAHTGEDWFGGKSDFDEAVRARFAEMQQQAERAELFRWRATPRGRLAEIIVLDQFSRQLYRGEARAFASDALALALAQEAVAAGHHRELSQVEQQFLLLPYMHSESLVIHEEAVRLFTELDDADTLDFELKHVEVLKRFGRYPKRNQALGRVSTDDELAYMADNDRMF